MPGAILLPIKAGNGSLGKGQQWPACLLPEGWFRYRSIRKTSQPLLGPDVRSAGLTTGRRLLTAAWPSLSGVRGGGLGHRLGRRRLTVGCRLLRRLNTRAQDIRVSVQKKKLRVQLRGETLMDEELAFNARPDQAASRF
eukprot:6537-Hanusia_phi.AAC.1